ncbi:MAG: hypothetical protein L0I62_09835, partial [Gammaproteobacteria bacterium]|nr:hypothetical protein [Gammaproteobacteria bacterium]
MVGNHPAREHLIALFRQAIATVRADRLAEQALRGECFTHVIALGKAGEALAAGAWRASFPSSSPRPFPSSFPPSPPSSFPPSPPS